MAIGSTRVGLLLVFLGLFSILPASEGAYPRTFYANDDKLTNGSTRTFPLYSTLKLACKYLKGDISVLHEKPELYEVINGNQNKLSNVIYDVDHSLIEFVNYTIASGTGQHVYRCLYTSFANLGTAEVTIVFSNAATTNPPTNPPTDPTTNPPTEPSIGSSDSTSSTTSNGGGGKKFTGLNPLIYTISAVVLLGTLAVIAIITCWIRARRSFHSRVLHGNTTPQDYLDYISDSEFTPMTSSEFMASLQERPPTYNQSEEIESQQQRPENEESRDGGGDGGGGDEDGGGNGGSDPPSHPPPPPPPSQTRNELRTPPRDRREVQTRRNRPNPNRQQSASASGDRTTGTSTADPNITVVEIERDHEEREREEQPAETVVTQTEPSIELLINLDDVITNTSASVGPGGRALRLGTPTQEEINEIEAAVGAVHRRMSRVRIGDNETVEGSGDVEGERGGVEGGQSRTDEIVSETEPLLSFEDIVIPPPV